MNVFEVKIGKYTTRGNFQELEKFAVKSEYPIESVLNHLIVKYRPLSVQVATVAIVDIEIPKPKEEVVRQPTATEPKVTQDLVRVFEHREFESYFGLDFEKAHEELRRKRIEYSGFKNKFIAEAKKIISENNKGNFRDIALIDDESDMVDCDRMSFRIRIKGKIETLIK